MTLFMNKFTKIVLDDCKLNEIYAKYQNKIIYIHHLIIL